MHTVLEDHSQVTYAEIHDNETATTAVGVLRNAVAWFAERGVARAPGDSDNGRAATARSCGVTPAPNWVSPASRTRPYRPQTNGEARALPRHPVEGWAFKKTTPDPTPPSAKPLHRRGRRTETPAPPGQTWLESIEALTSRTLVTIIEHMLDTAPDSRVTGWPVLAACARALGDLDVDVSDVARIEQIAALEELKSATAAAQARLAVAFDRSQRQAQRDEGVPERKVGLGIAAQVALARRDSPFRGARHLGLAHALVEEMPHTLAALETGQIR